MRVLFAIFEKSIQSICQGDMEKSWIWGLRTGRLWRWPLLWLLLWLPWLLLTAQSSASMRLRERINAFPYAVVPLGTNVNLPQSQVASMAIHPVTKEMIISTAKGMVSYDGRSVSAYDIGHMYDGFIFGKMFSSDLYDAPLGLGHGILAELSNQPKTLRQCNAAYIHGRDWFTMDERGELLWRDAASGQWQFAETGLTKISHISLWGKDSVLLAGEKGATYLFNLANCSMQFFLQEMIKSVAFDSLHKQVFLLGDQLYRVTSGGLVAVDLPSVPGMTLHSLLYVDGRLLVSSTEGLFVLQNGRAERYSEEDVLPTNTLDQLLYEPVSQTVFVATGDRGLLKLVKKRFKSTFLIDGLSLGSSSSVVNWRDKRIFVGNHLDLIGIQGDSLRVQETGDSPVFSLGLVVDTLFVGRGDSLHAVLAETGEALYSVKPCSCFVRSVHRDRQGTYWVGTSSGLWRGSNLQHLTPVLPQFKNIEVISIFESSKGDLWMGSRVFLMALDKQGRSKYDFSNQQYRFAHGARSFYEDERGGIWIGTYGGGLLYFDGQQLVSLRDMPGYLLGDDIFTLAPDRQGYWIMTSNDGVRMVQQQAAYRFLRGELDHLVPYYFGAEDGIYNPEFNGGFHHNYAALGGEVFYFPSIKGVVSYHSKPLLERENSLMFRRIKIDGQVFTEVTVVPRTTRFLEFEFSDVSFNPFNNVYYQYRLISASEESPAWSTPQKSLSVVLSYLKPGDYKIQFRSIDASNRFDPPYVTYRFYVEPYFYETNWFYICGIVFFSLLTYLAVTFFQKKQQQRLEYESTMRNTITELQLGSIQAQMNPHFIFNALNVLVYLISFASVDKARSFAVSFSILLRKILEQSSKTFVTVGEEIETMKAYMEIQRERLSQPLSFIVTCPQELLPVQIPTMFVQPLLENAVIHGLAHADWPGRIELVLSQEGTGLRLVVTDNGIGRQKSQEINGAKDHPSKGMELIRKKIDLLRAKYNLNVSLEIADLHPDSGQGTIVSLLLETLN